MENFDGDELITIPFQKYRHLLECKERVKKFEFLFGILETDDDKLVKKLSELNIRRATVNSLEDVGIITVRDLASYIMSKHPRRLDDIWSMLLKFPGIGSDGARSLFLSVFR